MFKKIILSIIAITIVIVTVVVVNDESKDDITVYVEIIQDDLYEHKEIIIPKDSNFIIELNKVYDINIENGFLYKIDFLELNDNNIAYIAIYINDQYSRYGINNLKLNDNDKVSFIYTLV